MQIHQNRPLEKFTRFLFMYSNTSAFVMCCTIEIYVVQIYATGIIRINKIRTKKKKCRFTVLHVSNICTLNTPLSQILHLLVHQFLVLV